jgi:hypothetical protein
MRRLILLAFGGALALALSSATHTSAATAARTPGAVGVSLRDGVGYAAVSNRGSLLVRVGRGRVSVTDLPGGSMPSVSCDRRGLRKSRSTIVYRGRGVSCHVFGTYWRVRIHGYNIDADGVVRGYLALDREGARGRYSIDERPYRLWPAAPTRFRLGSG